ncbi:TPA: DUF1146 family protein [Streptococcus suis]
MSFTFAYGMAVLLVRLLFVLYAYRICQHIHWNQIMTAKGKPYAHALCVMVAITLGHAAASFILTIMEQLQSLLYSMFL